MNYIKRIVVFVVSFVSLNSYGMQRAAAVAKKSAPVVLGAGYAGYHCLNRDIDWQIGFGDLYKLPPTSKHNADKCRSILEKHGFDSKDIEFKQYGSANSFHSSSRGKRGIVMVGGEIPLGDVDVFSVLHEYGHIDGRHVRGSAFKPLVANGLALAVASVYLLKSPTKLRALLRVVPSTALFAGTSFIYPKWLSARDEREADQFAIDAIKNHPSKAGLLSLYYIGGYYNKMHLPQVMSMLTGFTGENYFRLSLEDQIALVDRADIKLAHFLNDPHPMHADRAKQALGAAEEVRDILEVDSLENAMIYLQALEAVEIKIAPELEELHAQITAMELQKLAVNVVVMGGDEMRRVLEENKD